MERITMRLPNAPNGRRRSGGTVAGAAVSTRLHRDADFIGAHPLHVAEILPTSPCLCRPPSRRFVSKAAHFAGLRNRVALCKRPRSSDIEGSARFPCTCPWFAPTNKFRTWFLTGFAHVTRHRTQLYEHHHLTTK